MKYKPIPVNIGVSDDGLYFTKKNLLADNPETMEKLFANCKSIIAIHSKRRNSKTNEQAFREQYGEDVPVSIIQLLGVPKAVTKLQNVRLIWLKHNARLHILHLKAKNHLFQNDIPLQEKK
jgi:dihydroorotase